VNNPVATMPQTASIPAGYSIVIALQNGAEGRVTGATFTVTALAIQLATQPATQSPILYQRRRAAGCRQATCRR